jgi:hypothetical protein
MSTRFRSHPSWTPAERLARWTRRDPLSGCLIWRGKPGLDGYGRLRIPPDRTELAHRFAWAVRHGPIPKGAILCHRCDERRCVNPDHLFLGTHALNSADRKAKMKARATLLESSQQPAPRRSRRNEPRAQIRIVYRGLEMVGEVVIRPLLGLGACPEVSRRAGSERSRRGGEDR